MKIMSLNVNRFSGMNNRDFTNLTECLADCPKANEIIATVKGFLGENPDGAVFLYEVPYGQSQNRRVMRKLYRDFRNQFPECQFQLSTPGENALSCTLSIVQNEKGWSEQTCNFVNGFQNKYTSILHKKSGFRILGIHAPVEGYYPKEVIEEFFNKLQEFAKEHKEEPLIILGDMNVHSEKPDNSYFITFNTIRESIENGGVGYSDKVKDGEKTYFVNGNTLDHILVSPKLKDKVTAYVVPRYLCELSDHAVIIVDVNL